MPEFQPAPASLPEGHRVYAIGDVHGCDDRLARLHRSVAEDLSARPVARPLLLHIGDYVDKGPDSAGVVARLAAGLPLPGVPTVNLMGNHERTMLDALNGERAARTDWLFTGGRPALASWGADPDAPPDVWRASIPPEHQDFLHRLALHHREGGYLFVHAGIRPGVPLIAPEPTDLMWIRKGWLDDDSHRGPLVVHGHTVVDQPTHYGHRVNLDAGAGYGEPLVAAAVEGREVWLLSEDGRVPLRPEG